MIRQNLAIHSTSEVYHKKKELESKWEHFIEENQEPSNIRTEVYHSWKRCQKYGVNPFQKHSPTILSDDMLDDIISNSQLYNVSLPILKELREQIKGTKHIITLCDNKGRIIYIDGDNDILRKAETMNFVKGAEWSEKKAGSNAIGTCIALESPIQIFAYEHYCEGVHPWVCSAAPIKDPLTGKLLGVIDLTGPSELAQPHSLGVAQNISVIIQRDFSQISRKDRQIILEKYNKVTNKRKEAATIALDEMLNVVTAGTECLSLLNIKEWKQLWNSLELQKLRSTLLNFNGKEHQVYLASLQLYVYIQNIIHEHKHIGFLLHLEKSKRVQPLQINNTDIWRSLIGKSNTYKEIIKQAQVVAPTNVPLLITGETGTGKERFAQAIHQASVRRESPLIALNCGAIPKELVASELFGYEPGAFTGGNPKGKKGKFEEAQGGTLFLDEIGEMPLEIQVHLLRALQEKEITRLGSSQAIPINVRIIAATNRNLNDLIAQGLFRKDLYFRLNVVELKLPPLRERTEDIPALCEHFTNIHAQKLKKPVPTIDEQVFSFLQQYQWPGNIRELENAMQYAVLFCENNHITISSLPDFLQVYGKQKGSKTTTKKLTPLEEQEKKQIVQLLTETKGNLSEIARQCGIARSTLYRKMRKYNLR